MEHFEDDMDDLVSAEDFLDYFGIDYDASIVQVNRLHILQRFHNYLSEQGNLMEMSVEERYQCYKLQLARAYQDFVSSDALTEKVFRVFHMHEPQTAFVPVESLLGQ